MLRVLLLGEFSIEYDTVPIKGIQTPRLQSLLTYLILHTDAPQDRSHLAFTFWPDTSEKQALTNLRNLLYKIRFVLPNADSYIEVNPQTMQWLQDSAFTVDTHEFQENIRLAEEASGQLDHQTAQAALKKAIEIYRGDLLPSCYDDWIVPFREELRRKFLNALESLIDLLERGQKYPAAIHYAQLLLDYDPLNELTYQHLIRLFALNNDRASALRIYHVCETVLQRDLEVKPSLATREAYENLLGDEGHFISSQKTPTFFPVVGREQEWAQVLQIWRSAISGRGPKVLILCGEAGIGKTRLLEEMIQWVNHQGITNANSNCYAAEGQLAYAPVIAWLRSQSLSNLEDVWLTEIGRLLPEVLLRRPDLPKPSPWIEEWRREHLFEALSRAILEFKQPLLLTLDDLQWCDRDTLEWLHFLLRFDPKSRLLILGTYRPEEVTVDHPIYSFIQSLQSEGGVVELNLDPLDQGATQTLASYVAGEELSPEITQFLYQQSEGNPLIVVEVLRSGFPIAGLPENGQALSFPFNTKPVEQDLPLKVYTILKARIGQLSPKALELAWLAAVIGRDFNFSLLMRASGRDENALVNELDELWQRRIVREEGINSYNFSHDKLREVVYQSMSSGRRLLLHRQVAQALEACHRPNPDPVSYQLALHYEAAGLPERAVSYYLMAAEAARNVYANQEARKFIHRGLSILDTMEIFNQEKDQLAEHLWEVLGDLCVLSAETEEALAAYHNAQKRVSPSEKIDQARLLRKIAETLREEQRYAETLTACQQAEVILGNQPSEDVNRWWNEWIDVQIEKVWAYYWLDLWKELEALVERINLVVKVRASGISRMRFLMASCLMNLRKYRYVVSDEMLENSKESFNLSREYGSQQNQMDCLFELGFLHLWRREFDLAEEYLTKSLKLAENTGNVLFQTLNLTYLTVLFRFRNMMKDVANYAARTEKAAEDAHMPDYVAAARANQAWIAWREDDHHKAEQQSCLALEIWQKSPLIYPFQWMAFFPRIGVALAENRHAHVWDLISKILESSQQILPESLDILLRKALRAEEQISFQESLAKLEEAIKEAKFMGYL